MSSQQILTGLLFLGTARFLWMRIPQTQREIEAGGTASGLVLAQDCATHPKHVIVLDRGDYTLQNLNSRKWHPTQQFTLSLPKGMSATFKTSTDPSLEVKDQMTFAGPVDKHCVRLPFMPLSIRVMESGLK